MDGPPERTASTDPAAPLRVELRPRSLGALRLVNLALAMLLLVACFGWYARPVLFAASFFLFGFVPAIEWLRLGAPRALVVDGGRGVVELVRGGRAARSIPLAALDAQDSGDALLLVHGAECFDLASSWATPDAWSALRASLAAHARSYVRLTPREPPVRRR